MSSNTLLFWLIAAGMTGLALAFVLPRLLTLRAPPARMRRAAMNAAIYRSEVASLAGERAEGHLTDEQYALAREELERRLLRDTADAADDAAVAVTSPPSRATALAIAVALPLLAVCVYAMFGEPAALQAPTLAAYDAPGATPVAAPRREDLVAHLARNARDGRAWVLLARVDFDADRYADAGEAYAKALAASPKIAADPALWCEYADALGMAQGGTLAGAPRALIQRALALDPAHPKALEMAGGAAFEERDYAGALRYWQALLALLPQDSRGRGELAAAIARTEQLALASGAPQQAAR